MIYSKAAFIVLGFKKFFELGYFFIPRTISIEGKAYMVKMAVAAIPFGREMPRFGRQFVLLISGRLAGSYQCIGADFSP